MVETNEVLEYATELAEQLATLCRSVAPEVARTFEDAAKIARELIDTQQAA